MLLSFFVLWFIMSQNTCYTYLTSTTKSPFEFTETARNALCPFVGTEGMQCFDGEPIKRPDKQFDVENPKLPRGVGISVDRSTGRLKALAVQLTYSPETGRTWTDRFTDAIFDVYNEGQLIAANRTLAAFNSSRIQTFRNASELNAVWQQTFVDGRIHGGSLATAPDLFKYMHEFSKRGNALVLSQSIVPLYMLTLNPSTIQLNSFARVALSKLTASFDLDLYEDFVDKWGTHIITRSLIGGMIEEQAKISPCFQGKEHDLVVHCLPFEDRHSSNPFCAFYTDRNRVVSQRRLGGNVQANSGQAWRGSLSFAPAMLQILEMRPWYDFVKDESIKKNLRTIIRSRQNLTQSSQAAVVRVIDGNLPSCTRGIPSIIASLDKALPNIPLGAVWNQNGVTIAGGNGQGSANHQFYHPFSISFDDEDEAMTIADAGNNRIIQWKVGHTSGKVIAGGIRAGIRLDQLDSPTDVVVDRETNSVIICDSGNGRVVRWSYRKRMAEGQTLVHSVPCRAIAMDDQRNLYVSDVENDEVRRYELGDDMSSGVIVAGGNGKGSNLNQLNGPLFISVDRQQAVYISDISNHRVVKWNKGAKEGIIVAGGRGGGNAMTQLFHPEGLYVDSSGSVYVAESGNKRVTRWHQGASEGTIILGENAQLPYPVGLTFDRHNNIYVAGYADPRIKRFSII